MTTGAEYRENAAVCLQAMQAATSRDVRAALQNIAARWVALAERAEQASRNSRASARKPAPRGSAGDRSGAAQNL
jgi:hypothetical protein